MVSEAQAQVHRSRARHVAKQATEVARQATEVARQATEVARQATEVARLARGNTACLAQLGVVINSHYILGDNSKIP